MSPVEILAAVLTAWGVWLQGRRRLLNFPVNLVGVLLYAWVFFHAKLYSDLLLQVFFAATLGYGWWQWTRGIVPDGTVSVATPRRTELLLGVAAGVVGIVLLGYPMSTYTDAAAPWLDAALTSFSLVANLWLARRYIINWWLWIGLDVIYVGLYAYKGLYITAGLYFILLVLCCYALVEWRRAVKRQAVPAQALPQPAA
jgi:nicotinamide mononucleotide transporter